MEKLIELLKQSWNKIAFWKKTHETDDEETAAASSNDSAITFKVIGIIFLVGLIGTIIVAMFSDPITRETLNPQGELVESVILNWVKLWLWCIVFYTIASYRFWSPVKTGDQAALAYFGRPYTNVGSGPPFAPLLVVQVLSITSQTQQQEFPAEPELIDRTELKNGYVIPPGKRPPLRVQFRDSITEPQARSLFPENEFVATSSTGETVEFVAEVSSMGAEADGLNRRVTAEVQHVARIRVDNPSLFFSNVPSGSTGNPLDEAFRQIEDEMVKILTQYLTRMSVAQALTNIRWISIHLQNAVERRVGAKGDRRSWGVDVQAAFVKLIHTDHGINIAISEAAQAPFQKTKTIIAAEGERKKRELEGKGAAVAARELEQRTLEGRAVGMKKLAAQINVSGAEAQAAEVARTFGQGGNTVVVGTEGFGQLAGIAAAALGKNKTKEDNS